ncbi:MAG: SPOR domain-containing protein [Lachnospiraceae bacterium]
MEEETEQEKTYYRVQTGAYRNRENAVRQQEKLTEEGYPAFLLEREGYYLIKVGAWKIQKMQYAWRHICGKMGIRPILPHETEGILKI